MSKITISTGHPDAGRVYAEAYDAALAREAALREDLLNMTSLATRRGDRIDSLRDRLTVAEHRAGELSRLDAALKTAAEGEGS